jgi:hypothetical protein
MDRGWGTIEPLLPLRQTSTYYHAKLTIAIE